MRRKIWMTTIETPCVAHEEQINENAKKIAELEAKNGFKAQRINELIEDNKRIESKIDNLTDTVNKVMLNSIKDDNNLNQRVTTLETTIKTQEDTIKQFEEKQRKQRDEDRQKANLRLAYIGIGLTILTIVLSYIIPHLLH